MSTAQHWWMVRSAPLCSSCRRTWSRSRLKSSMNWCWSIGRSVDTDTHASYLLTTLPCFLFLASLFWRFYYVFGFENRCLCVNGIIITCANSSRVNIALICFCHSVCHSVCVSVCLHDKTRTAESKSPNLARIYSITIPCPPMNIKSKGQRSRCHRCTKCKSIAAIKKK